MQTQSQGLNIGLRQGSRSATGTAYDCQYSRHLKDAHALGTLDADKDIARKQGKIQGDPRPVTPFALRLVKGQIVLDLPHAEMLIYALFMACRRVDRKPM
jgi:hypothetical protein